MVVTWTSWRLSRGEWTWPIAAMFEVLLRRFCGQVLVDDILAEPFVESG